MFVGEDFVPGYVLYMMGFWNKMAQIIIISRRHDPCNKHVAHFQIIAYALYVYSEETSSCPSNDFVMFDGILK